MSLGRDDNDGGDDDPYVCVTLISKRFKDT
jgi:hypothetical protein